MAKQISQHNITVDVGQRAVKGCLMPLLRAMKLYWEFTESDFATFVLPNSVFGVCAALAQNFELVPNVQEQCVVSLLLRLPLAILFNWTNLFIFDLENQRTAEAVIEDSINKPWRPLPSGKITIAQARRLTLASIPLVLAFNFCIDVWRETSILFGLTWLYNNLGGGDGEFRNLIIAIAFAVYNAGSTRVMLGPNSEISADLYVWIGVISCVILTTMHVQDLKDQEGDAKRGRKTIPLLIGDIRARGTIAISVVLSSFLCDFFWDVWFITGVMPLMVGTLVAWRTMFYRDPRSDSKIWRLWCLWTAVIYTLPVSKICQRAVEVY